MNGTSRRNFLKSAGAGMAALMAGATPLAHGAKKKTPNFVFFLVDDMGWRDAACFGSSFYDTPNIDRLAASGMRFTSAYAACPVCSPTRASIMAGKYPARMDTTDFFGAAQPSPNYRRNTPLQPARYTPHLPLEEVTLAETFKQAGYGTFFAGKWHLGGEGFYPEDQGFDVNKGGLQRGGPYGGKRYFSPYGNPKLPDGPDGEHLPDRLATEACRFMENTKAKGNPFLTYLSFYSVHTPLMAREDLKKKYQEKRTKEIAPDAKIWGTEGGRKSRLVQEHAVYGGMIEAMDQAVGKVLDKVDALGLTEETVIFFMSDNGGLSTSEGHPTSNLPLRAGKGWLYEGGIREPMIARWPSVTKPGSQCDEAVISTDFYPTMLDIAGLPAKPNQHCDGVTLTPLLRGKAKLKERPLFWHYPHYGNQGGSPGAAIREGDFKLIEFFGVDQPELYNLRKDIGETKNLADAMPKKTRDMLAKLHAWQKSVDAKNPTPNPNFKSSKKVYK